MKRRTFLERTMRGLAVVATPARVWGGQAPAVITSDRARPRIDYGVAAGDPAPGRAIVWAHVDRPARMTVEYSSTESFANVRRVTGSVATPETGLTAPAALGDLAGGP